MKNFQNYFKFPKMSVLTPTNTSEAPTSISSNTLEFSKFLIFPWTIRWLKGPEYRHLLNNSKIYSDYMGCQIYEKHPDSIYTKPQSNLLFPLFLIKFKPKIDGTIYYLIQPGGLPKVSFPRVGFQKVYSWRKMNFRTDLPKNDPLVI